MKAKRYTSCKPNLNKTRKLKMAGRPAQIVDAILASNELRDSIEKAVEASSKNTRTRPNNASVEGEVRSLFRPEISTQRQEQVVHQTAVRPSTLPQAQGQDQHQRHQPTSSSGILLGLPSTSGVGTYPIFQMRRNYTSQILKKGLNFIFKYTSNYFNMFLAL